MSQTNAGRRRAPHWSVLLLVSASPFALGAAADGQSRVSNVDLVPVQLNLPGTLTAGKSFVVLDEVENAGDDPAPRSVTGFCLSEDEVCDEKDVRLGARRVPPLNGRQAHAMQTPLKLPDTVAPGQYFVIAVADATGAIEERYRTNNTRATKTTVRSGK